MKHIDPHCHCRDGEEDYKTNIREVSEIAKSQDIVGIGDMAKVFTEKEAKERIELARIRQPVVRYFFYVRLTPDIKQIETAARIVRLYPEAIGLKTFVSCENELELIFQTLTDLGYTGVLANHCEKESLFRPELWNPQEPWTHGLAQPPEAETESIAERIRLAEMTHFPGILYICHISCPLSADLIWQAKKKIRIVAEVALSHLLFSQEDMIRQEKIMRGRGLLLKVNPPLRTREEAAGLLERSKQGKIDVYGSDHAPHTWEEKTQDPYLSGITSLPLYRGSLIWLNQQGLSWSEIERLTYWNIKEVFGEKLKEV